MRRGILIAYMKSKKHKTIVLIGLVDLNWYGLFGTVYWNDKWMTKYLMI